MIYGYIRVSTDSQNTKNQKFEIKNFAKQNSISIDEWIEDIGRAGKDDLIIANELSQLGRNLLQVIEILNHLLNTGVQVWTIKDGYKLGNDIASRMLVFVFGLSAEIERKMISQRTKEPLACVKAGGKVLGRPLGRRNSKSKLANRASEVHHLLSCGYSRAAVARKLNVHRDTLAAFLNHKPCE
jgi:DNA invertase Pin-like site-specific DNA recombinase